jgi:hypothetical protein
MSSQNAPRAVTNPPRPTLQTWFYRFFGVELVIIVLASLWNVATRTATINVSVIAKVISLSAVAALLFWCGQQCREIKD